MESRSEVRGPGQFRPGETQANQRWARLSSPLDICITVQNNPAMYAARLNPVTVLAILACSRGATG